MATIRKINIIVDTTVELILNEDELKALDALFGYGIDAFLDVFYKSMGRSYLSPHEAGLRSLAQTIRGCGGLADEAQECREFLKKAASNRLKLELDRRRSILG